MSIAFDYRVDHYKRLALYSWNGKGNALISSEKMEGFLPKREL